MRYIGVGSLRPGVSTGVEAECRRPDLGKGEERPMGY